jgi:hypothetical protein
LCLSTGIPRPLSSTTTDESFLSVTLISDAKPANASSTALSKISQTKWCKPCTSVEPMYIPGLLRTASRPLSVIILSAL